MARFSSAARPKSPCPLSSPNGSARPPHPPSGIYGSPPQAQPNRPVMNMDASKQMYFFSRHTLLHIVMQILLPLCRSPTDEKEEEEEEATTATTGEGGEGKMSFFFFRYVIFAQSKRSPTNAQGQSQTHKTVLLILDVWGWRFAISATTNIFFSFEL